MLEERVLAYESELNEAMGWNGCGIERAREIARKHFLAAIDEESEACALLLENATFGMKCFNDEFAALIRLRKKH
jgi:hypothetical protein